MSHPPYSEISSRKRDVHFSEAPLNLVLSGIVKRSPTLAPWAAASSCENGIAPAIQQRFSNR